LKKWKLPVFVVTGIVMAAGSTPGLTSLAFAQENLPAPVDAPAPAARTEAAPAPTDPEKERAARLIDEALTVAYRNPEARPALARGAAALLPQLQGRTREGLTNRWIALISTNAVSRGLRLAAMSSFFDAVSQSNNPDDWAFGRDVALALPDATARAGALIQLSEAAQKTSWDQAAEWAHLAQRAARQETDQRLRARAQAYVATRMATLDPTARYDAVVEASTQAHRVERTGQRDALLAEVVGAAAKFDIGLAQRIAEGIENQNLKNLALARIAVAQAQVGLAVQKPDADRIAKIVNGVPRYDTSFIPVLLQLPPSPEVFEALGKSLPMIYPDAPLAVEPGTLERIWNFTAKAEPSVFRDQLQSRVARLMVLHDLWRGREWGRQLAWKGGQDQIARFVDETVKARESYLQTETLRTQTMDNINSAILITRRLVPAERVEGLLLIAGKILG
jgi:hypothetical protein